MIDERPVADRRGGMGKSCVVAVVQAEVAPDRGDGLARTAQLAHAAARSGVELIVFPERGS